MDRKPVIFHLTLESSDPALLVTGNTEHAEFLSLVFNRFFNLNLNLRLNLSLLLFPTNPAVIP